MYIKTTAIINADGPVDAQMELSIKTTKNKAVKLMQQRP